MHSFWFSRIGYGSNTRGTAQTSRVWFKRTAQGSITQGNAQDVGSVPPAIHKGAAPPADSRLCHQLSPAVPCSVGPARCLREHPTAPARAKPSTRGLGCSGHARSILSPGSVIASYGTRCPQDLARSLVQSRRARSRLGPCTAFLRGANFIGKEESCSL